MSQDQLPDASTVVVHVSQSGPVTTIVAPISPVHVTVGVVSFVDEPFVGAVMTKVGGVISILSG